MGRPAKPTHLKLLAGDDKKNPQRVNRKEPVPADEPVAPPWELTEEGRVVWDRMAPDRIAKGVLTAWDTDAFAFLCESVALAQSKLRGADREPKPGAASPMAEFRAAMAVVSSLGSRFGWTPSDRSKLVVGEADRDPKERLLS